MRMHRLRDTHRSRAGRGLAALLLLVVAMPATAQAPAQPASRLPIFDAHVHYSHDAWSQVPVAEVLALMRKAGLHRAMVSSSNDDGTRRPYDAAPELIVPSLRPYRTRSEIGTWVRDESVARHLEERLARYRYAAIGEFHLYGADADLPVPRRMIELARRDGLLLHAHSDADAIERIFRQDPGARVIWAHSGFIRPEEVRDLLRKHPRLWADLAFRTDMGGGAALGAGQVDPGWREAFVEFPDRFMVGTDTFTPERLHYIPEHAEFSRGWLRALPPELAERIAWRNAEAVIGPVWAASRARPRPGAGGGAGAAPWAAAAQAGEAAAAAGTAVGGSPAGCEASAPAAGTGLQRLEGQRVDVLFRLPDPPPRLGQAFALEATVCPRRPQETVRGLALDARMPEHQHGMNYAPRIVSDRPGHYLVDGLLFHMAGRWQLLFDVRLDGRSERLAHDLRVR